MKKEMLKCISELLSIVKVVQEWQVYNALEETDKKEYDRRVENAEYLIKKHS